MKESKLLGRDVKAFMETQRYLFASVGDRRFYVALRSCPNVQRYFVEISGETKGFVKVGEAVKYFNDGHVAERAEE